MKKSKKKSDKEEKKAPDEPDTSIDTLMVNMYEITEHLLSTVFEGSGLKAKAMKTLYSLVDKKQKKNAAEKYPNLWPPKSKN